MNAGNRLNSFYRDQNNALLNSIKQIDTIQQNNSSFSNLNVLFLGPSISSKSLLIKLICQAMGEKENRSNERIETQGLVLFKTELTKQKVYKLNQKQYKERKGINLYEFHEKISLNSLNCFSKLFEFIEQASNVLCNCKTISRSAPTLQIQSVILVLDVGKTMETEQLQCIRYILDDLKQRQIQPIIAICSHSSDNLKSQQQKIDLIQQQIKSAQQLFSIARENIVALQLNQQLTPQKTYYILRLLNTSLLQAAEFASKHSIIRSVKKQGWKSFFPCWV